MPNKNKIVGIWDRDNPPSGAIPRFPIWEVMAMVFAVVTGIGGIIYPTSSRFYALMGDHVTWWFIALILAGSLSLIGLWMRPVNGLIINLIGVSILATACLSVLAGFIVYYERPIFSGSATLYVFGLGGLLRVFQILNHIRSMRIATELVTKYPPKEDR